MNLTLRIAGFEHFQTHLAAGLRVLSTPKASVLEAGFNGSLAMEAYPLSPLVLRGAADVGNIGHAFFADVRGSLGVMLNRFELFVGYSGMWIGNVAFHGPFGGLRLHL
jgi:hypothetical protein